MEKLIIIRYSEIFLKGNNRRFFENLLIKNIKETLKNIDCRVLKIQGRMIVNGYEINNESIIIEKLKKIFGIHSISAAVCVDSDMEVILKECENLVRPGTFKIETHRADKTFPLNSMQISREIGGKLLEKFDFLTVDVHKPSFIINLDLRENGKTFIFSDFISGIGGMPVGSSGTGALLLSGGIDSPVAGYLLSKRGMRLIAIHFYSYPYTSEYAKQKVITLAEKIAEYSAGMQLFVVPFTEIQEQIHKNCNPEYMITIMRRFMMRISQKIAIQKGAGALINGECLGQVASQTLESINVTNQVCDLPVFRPLIGFDKNDIIKIAEKIGTYETSILPYEDCCTVFLPKNPVIKPKLKTVEFEEKNLKIEELIEKAISNVEIINI